MGRVLWPCWIGVLETGQCFLDISRHGDVDIAEVIMPFEGEAIVVISFPVCGDDVLAA